jgi:hypothetical protein
MSWLWLLSVLVPLAGLGAMCLKMMDTAHWSGTPGPHGPIRIVRQKDRIVSISAGVAATNTMDFELRRELWYDRLLKRHRLAFEAQSGHAGFDQAFFVLADDPAVIERLRHDHALCDRLLDLCGPGVPPGYRFARVVCAGGTLWAEYGWTRPLVAPDVDRLTGGLQLRLQAIAPQLPFATPGEITTAQYVRRAALRLEQAALVVFLAGIAGLLVLLVTGLPQILDRRGLWSYAAGVAAVFLYAIFDWGRRHLGRSPRAHRLAAIWLFVGAPGLLVCAMLWVRQLDIGLDRRASFERSGSVLGLHVNKGRRGLRRYSADVLLRPREGDPDGRTEKLRLQLDADEYARLPRLGGVRVVEHPGLLGLRWVDDVQREPDWRRDSGGVSRPPE